MPRNRDIEQTLRRKYGFEDDVARGSDHRYIRLELPSGRVVRTHFSHGNQDLGAPLLSKIARQLGVTKATLTEMLSCHVSRDEYYQIAEDAS